MEPQKLKILVEEPELDDKPRKKQPLEPAASTTRARRTGRLLLDLQISGAAAARRERLG